MCQGGGSPATMKISVKTVSILFLIEHLNMFANFWVFACPLVDIASWQSTIPLKLLCKQQSTIPSSDGLRIVVGCQKIKIISKNIIKHYFLYPTIDLDPKKSPIRVCQGGSPRPPPLAHLEPVFEWWLFWVWGQQNHRESIQY